VALGRNLAAQMAISGGENMVQFFHKGDKLFVVMLNRDTRTEVVNLVTFFFVHGVAEVLQDWPDQVCSMSNVGKPKLHMQAAR
jgi:hypothetical protein